VDSNNNLFITDEENHKIRKIDITGVVTTYAGTGVLGDTDGISTIAQFHSPTGVVIDATHNVYICDYENNKIKKINDYGYAIYPHLPDGLTLDSNTGIISGTPTTVMPSTDFTVTASNPDGTSSFVINITIGQLELSNFDSSFIKVYPNPVQDVLTIASSNSISKIKIFNLLGQEILSKSNLSPLENFTISNWANGWYFVKATIENSIKTIKVLKQ
jgi:hypothetical protein